MSNTNPGTERFKLSAALLSAIVMLPALPAAAGTAELTVAERAGVDRVAEPVTSGVPIPRGELASYLNCRLLRDGAEIPAQFRDLANWRPENTSIRWLLVDFQADLKANAKQPYTLEFGQGVRQEVKLPAPGGVADSPDSFEVSTGGHWFTISRKNFSLFEEVKLADGTVVVPRRTVDRPRVGALLRGVRAMATRAIPAAGNTGRSHLIYVRYDGKGPQEDYTLRFTTDRDYELSGAGAGKLGAGGYAKDFASTDGHVTIPADAWLKYAYPKKGDAYTFRTIPDGTDVAAEGIYEAKLIEPGALRTVIRVTGSFGPATAPVMEFTAWYHFHHGGQVRLDFTLENNNHGGRTDTGNARNADIGGINCVFFDELALMLPTTVAGDGQVQLAGDPGTAAVTAPVTAPAELYQDSSGGDRWDRYKDARFNPRPNSYVSFRGCRVFSGDRQSAEGRRAAGVLDVSDARKGATVAVRDFWQNFPKSLGTSPDGTVKVGLFPARYAGDFAFRTGEHKTHQILFQFHSGQAKSQAALSAGRAFSDPLRAEVSPAWFARTRALGDLHPFDETNYKAYEVRNLSAIGVFPEGVKPGPSIISRIEEMNFFGWMDYGDVPIDFEAPSGQWNLKYDLDFQMAVQYARTGRAEWWRLFSAAARHMADIDIHHQPHHPGLHFVKGGQWPHSLHNEPGHRNPHRNYNHFSKDLSFGARGTAAYHYLTGDWKARQSCLELAENGLAQYMSPQAEPDRTQRNRMGVRGDACTLNRLLEGYLLTGEERFLARARWQIADCAFDGRPAAHPEISLWSSLFYMMALARYVELFPDDAPARGYLVAHMETLRKGITAEGIYYSITPQPDGSAVGKGAASHYNVMAADCLAIGHRLTGRNEFMDAARQCFAYGVANACWKNGPPTYFHIHGANGATHGNTFMAVNSQLRAQDR